MKTLRHVASSIFYCRSSLSDPRQDAKYVVASGLSSPVVMSVLPPNRDQQIAAYEISDQPRHLTADDLGFLAKYTGKSTEVLRPHVYSVWRSTKEQVLALSRSCRESAVCVRCSVTDHCLCLFELMQTLK